MRAIQSEQEFATISAEIENLDRLNSEAETRWEDRIVFEPSLSRPLVSFQASKDRAIYRWFKYKEAFSADLVRYLLRRFSVSTGILLDPFAGSGTALFAAASSGVQAEGIELLPIGQEIIATRNLVDRNLRKADIARLKAWLRDRPWLRYPEIIQINELRITRGAYPNETLQAIGRFLAALQEENDVAKSLLFFALLCVLESVSYTRKDGQYLRWDYRSERRQGKKIFDKGEILPFEKAICQKMAEMIVDISVRDTPHDLFETPNERGQVTMHSGSCLKIMPILKESSYDCLITSPPYCNRYDYTRTYALELALLDIDEGGISNLRQEMLSCTVENRAKDLLALNPHWTRALSCVEGHNLLQEILAYLDSQKDLDLLNNAGIPRMVRGYFYEMACVIFECARVLKSDAPMIMVNDNVRYAGVGISVDIILSEIAENLGFVVEQILVLPNGKGNSSQQMGAHGRKPLRKCVYVWRKA